MVDRVLLAFVLGMSVPAVAGAQVLERPQRARPPRTEATSWRTVTVSATTLGSYDDNLTADQFVLNPDVTSQSGIPVMPTAP